MAHFSALFRLGFRKKSVFRLFPVCYASDRRRLRIISHRFVQLAKFELVKIALGNLAYDAGGLASDNSEAGYDHVGGHDGAIEDAHVVFDDCKLVDNDVVTDIDVGTDGGGLDNGAFADKNVVANT